MRRLFMFPKHQAVDTLTAEEQVKKVSEELEEVLTAPSPARKLEEALDVLHAVETLLRIVLKETDKDEHDAHGMISRIVKKNSVRGYYKPADKQYTFHRHCDKCGCGFDTAYEKRRKCYACN